MDVIFKFIKLKPGKVVTTQFGEIDFNADTIGIEIIKTLYENGFPYLEITAVGKAELYGAVSKMESADLIVKTIRTKKNRSNSG